MNILVCLKAVPSTDQVQVDGQFRLRRDGAKLQWNIADEAALEAALQLKGISDSLTVITMGPEKLLENMQELLARGADQAVLISDPVFAGADTIATAKTLAAAIQKLGSFDLILCGRRAMDGETGQVPPMLAAALDIPCITGADEVSLRDGQIHIQRRLEYCTMQLQQPLPCCISLCEYTYTLRLPGIMALRRAKGKTVQLLRAEDLQLDAAQCGLKGSLTKVVAMQSRFPGLRKGPKEALSEVAVQTLRSMIREVAK